MNMKMTPALVVIGGLLVFWASVFIAVILPGVTMDEKPSEIWRTWTPDETAGHLLYVQNGCSYCHSMFIRTIDWDLGAERIAQRGDYAGYTPAILGTERTGPDLSQEGGEHPEQWHFAHFANPRYTRPMSLMPSWEFLGHGQDQEADRVHAVDGRQQRRRARRAAGEMGQAGEGRVRGRAGSERHLAA